MLTDHHEIGILASVLQYHNRKHVYMQPIW